MDSRFPLNASVPSRNNSITEDEVIFPTQAAARGMSVSSASGSPLPPIAVPPSQSIALPPPTAGPPSISVSPVSPTDSLSQNGSSSPYNPSPVLASGSGPSSAHQNQVPIAEEFDLDTISVEPPPYTRYAALPAGAPKQTPPQLNLVNPNALARGLPTIPLAAATAPGDSTPSSAHPLGAGHYPYGMSAPPSRLTLTDRNNNNFVDSTSNLALIPGGPPNAGVARRSFRERMSEVRSEKSGSMSGKRVFGIKVWWIVVIAAVGSIVLSIILGVTLGLVLRDKRTSQDAPALGGDDGRPDDGAGDDPAPGFPDKDVPPGGPNGSEGFPRFPSSMQIINVTMTGQTRTCLAADARLPTMPDEINDVMWSCDIPELELRWEIEEIKEGTTLLDLGAKPKILPRVIQNGGEIKYLISSQEMKNQIKNQENVDYGKIEGLVEGTHQAEVTDNQKMVTIEGVQPPKFFRQPLVEVSGNSSISSSEGPPEKKFKFEIVYTKEIVLRQESILKLLNDRPYMDGERWSMNINGTEIGIDEEVWFCEWQKTYFTAEVWMGLPRKEKETDIRVLNTVTIGNGGTNSPAPPKSDSDPEIKAMSVGVKTDKLNTDNLIDLPDYMAQEKGPSNIPPVIAKAQIFKDKRSPDGGSQPTQLPSLVLRTRIREERPTERELRKIMGMEDGDVDVEGNAKRGPIQCSRKIGAANGDLKSPDVAVPKILPEIEERAVEETLMRRWGGARHGVRRRQQQKKGDCLCLWEA